MKSVADELLAQIDTASLPRHIAIIMDGNGRWAGKRGLPRVAGHKAGTRSVRQIVEGCAELHIEALTLYAFSLENWKRPRAEVRTLMSLLREYLVKELETLCRNNIRLQTIGRTDELDPSVQKDLARTIEKTHGNTGMVLSLALNYGGRAEIVDAVKRMMKDPAIQPEDVTEERFGQFLYTAGLPDPDLLIRTSGELRVSNFLLWQIAYAEIFVTDTLWPDFDKAGLYEAIAAFQKRERRYGGLESRLVPTR